MLRDDVRLLTLTGPAAPARRAWRSRSPPRSPTGSRTAPASSTSRRSPIRTGSPSPSPRCSASRTPATASSTTSERFLHDRSLLLLLDNFEQILPAGPLLADLLSASPGLKILVTSRAALQVRGEHELDVPPLAVPDLEQRGLARGDRTAWRRRLFVERARAVRADFALTTENAPAVATICTRLDGLPLALELAAARTRLLTPEALAERLERRLTLLTHGPRDAPARQRTLRDTIAWSYDLLDPEEQRAFRALSVFVGGFTLDAGCRVIGDGDADRPASSPITHDLSPAPSMSSSSSWRGAWSGGSARSAMSRASGCWRRSASTAWRCWKPAARLPTVRTAHLAWCAAFTDRERGVRGPAFASWLNRLDAEHDNFRAAMLWADRSGDVTGDGLRLASNLGRNFWAMRGHHREGRAWLDRLLARTPSRSILRASALLAAGRLALRQNDYPAAQRTLREAVDIFRELGDRPGLSRALGWLGVVPHHLGQYDEAQAILEESLAIARALDDTGQVSIALRFLADLAQDRGDATQATLRYAETLAIAREAADTHDIAYALRGLGHIARSQGQYALASERLRESLALLKPLNDRRCIPLTIEGLACITVGPGWADRSARLLGAAQAMQAVTGAPSPPSAMADYERTVADARQALGSERFEAAWAAGAAMSLEEAVDLALAAPGPDAATRRAARRPRGGTGRRTSRRSAHPPRAGGRRADRPGAQQPPDLRGAHPERPDRRAAHRERLQPPRHQRQGRARHRHGVRSAPPARG